MSGILDSRREGELGNIDENFSAMFEQAFAGFGNNYRAWQTIEQPVIHFRFQLLNLLTKRRLSDMFAGSGAREAPLFSYSNEVTELMDLHGPGGDQAGYDGNPLRAIRSICSQNRSSSLSAV